MSYTKAWRAIAKGYGLPPGTLDALERLAFAPGSEGDPGAIWCFDVGRVQARILVARGLASGDPNGGYVKATHTGLLLANEAVRTHRRMGAPAPILRERSARKAAS